MSKPTVAIVGRPNVGKSTLFNRLVGGRRAIVSEEAGTTRDRHFGDAEWAGRKFWLIDTGGLVPDSDDSMDRAIRRQVDIAVEEADLIVLVVDGRDGINPVDREIAARLRKADRPVLVAVNKLDDLPESMGHLAFYELGLGDPLPVSAQVGKATGDLLDEMVRRLPPKDPLEDEEAIQVAVVGRPNAGKSSLINRLLGEDRHVVSPVPGTTRDAIDSPLRYHGKTLNFIDTAGLRKRSKVEDDIEFYSTLRTRRAIDRADVCVLVVDAVIGLHNQDLRIATEAWDSGCGLLIVVNKWDLIEEKDTNTAKRGQDELIREGPVPPVRAVRLHLGVQRAAGHQDSGPDSRGRRCTPGTNPDLRGEPGAGGIDPAQRAAPETGRRGQAPVRVAGRDGTAGVRHRLQPSDRRAGVVPAVPESRVQGGVAVHRLPAEAQVHQQGRQGETGRQPTLTPAARRASHLQRPPRREAHG